MISSEKNKAMASAAGRKPVNPAEADRKPFQQGRVQPWDRRFNGPVVYALAALLLAVAGYLLFGGSRNTMPLPTIAETVPSPDINSTVDPAPATPPPSGAPATNP